VSRLIPLLVLTIVLSATGCGIGGEETPGAQPTKVTFVRKADAICAKAYKQIESGFKSFVGSAGREPFSNIEEIQKFADTVLIPVRQKEVEELGAVGAPREDEDRVRAILEAYEEGIEKAEESARNAVLSSAGVFVKATELAEEYGLKECRH